MKRIHWFGIVWVCLVALIILGCGGGGGGGGTSATSTSTSSTSTSTSGNPGDSYVTKIEAQISPGVYMDPLNIQVGQTVQFVLVKFDVTTGGANTISTNNYSASGAVGTLSSSGTFTANVSSSNTYQVSTSFNGTSYNANYKVNPAQPKVYGQTVDTNNKGVPFAVMQFYDSSSNLVGQSATDVNGNFIASVPATAVRFNISSTSLSTANYYSVFIYGAGTYNVLSTVTCSAPLPTLSGTTAVALPNTVQIYATTDSSGIVNTPPSAPGCSP